jgi:2-amino-4-hydroxy-6-hydroxymethyldihydropteridine diphosphokinase
VVEVFLGLGSNIQPQQNVPACLARLREGFAQMRVSPIYACEPVGFVGGMFWNLVVSLHTQLSLPELLQRLRAIELALGRPVQAKKYVDRTIDIDLLTFGEFVGQLGEVQVPRPAMLQQAFVLGPLAALAPTAVHPVCNTSYQALWQDYLALYPAQTLHEVTLDAANWLASGAAESRD